MSPNPRWILLLLTALAIAAFLVTGCRAEITDAPPAKEPNAPAAIEWLDRVQAKSDQIKTLQADLRYDRNQGLVGDKQRRFGTLIFEAGPPKKFAVHFDRLLVDGRGDPQDRWFIFDGQWLVERHDDEKLFVKRQLVPPDAPPDQADPLEWGKGPFVLPITANKARVLQRFDVWLLDPDKDDSPNSVHLKLTPREGRASDFTQVDLWYGRDSLLPVRVRTLDDSENETIVQMSKPRVNEPVPDKAFDTGEPKDGGWKIETAPWEGK